MITLETTLREFQLQQRVRELEHQLLALGARTIAPTKPTEPMDFKTELPKRLELLPVASAHLSYGALGWQLTARAKSGSAVDYLAISEYIEASVIAQLGRQETAQLLAKIYAKGLGLIAQLAGTAETGKG